MGTACARETNTYYFGRMGLGERHFWVMLRETKSFSFCRSDAVNNSLQTLNTAVSLLNDKHLNILNVLGEHFYFADTLVILTNKQHTILVDRQHSA